MIKTRQEFLRQMKSSFPLINVSIRENSITSNSQQICLSYGDMRQSFVIPDDCEEWRAQYTIEDRFKKFNEDINRKIIADCSGRITVNTTDHLIWKKEDVMPTNMTVNTTDHLIWGKGDITFTQSLILRPVIKKVIFNDPATIVFFEDGCKEVVKVKPGEQFDEWTGLAMCIMKRMYGPAFHGLFKKWCKREEKKPESILDDAVDAFIYAINAQAKKNKARENKDAETKD